MIQYFLLKEHSTSIANDQLQVLFNIFSELPQRVLIEWHGGDIAAKPKNVLVRKQLPRQDILGHPNTMLLVSHGSMADVTEAIFHGRPLLSMPIQGEELSNADRIVKIGLGEVLQWPQLTEETLKYVHTYAVLSNFCTPSMSSLGQSSKFF